jgi:hypothetical protein
LFRYENDLRYEITILKQYTFYDYFLFYYNKLNKITEQYDIDLIYSYVNTEYRKELAYSYFYIPFKNNIICICDGLIHTWLFCVPREYLSSKFWNYYAKDNQTSPIDIKFFEELNPTWKIVLKY